MTRVSERVQLDVTVRAVTDRWTQFEQCPVSGVVRLSRAAGRRRGCA